MEVFDYAIIGAGAAGMQLAMAFLENDFLNDKKLLIIEPETKLANDRTWSFWERGDGKWDHLSWKQWSSAAFYNDGTALNFPVDPYRYKSIRAGDFNAWVLKHLRSHPAVTLLRDEVRQVEEGIPVSVVTASGNSYKATQVFDSRLPENYHQEKKNYPMVLQHFKGWLVESNVPVFDQDRFVMMDFRYKLPATTSFMYVLPEHPGKALVEFTFFSPALVAQEVYDSVIERYLREQWPGVTFSVCETEYGVIPMSSFPFHKYHTPNVLRIGTGGGWVKPASGYSFHNAMKNTNRIVKNLRAGKSAGEGLYSAKHRWYDTLLVDILQRRNEKGPEIFTQMYRRNSPSAIFSFLDEETSLAEELKIISSFNPAPFLAALGRQFF